MERGEVDGYSSCYLEEIFQLHFVEFLLVGVLKAMFYIKNDRPFKIPVFIGRRE